MTSVGGRPVAARPGTTWPARTRWAWGRPRFSASARAALGEAVRICRESATDDERGSRLRAEHVLLGILAVGDEQSRRLVESVTTVDRLRAALTAAV